MAQTKIVATIGPSSDNASTLREMVKNGLSAVRVNTAHIKEGYITKVRKMVDSVNSDMGSNIGIMIDLKGPELRTGTFEGGRFSVEEGDTYRLVSTGGSPGDILINYPSVFRSLQKGDEIVMSDGKVKFRVLENGSNSAELLAGSSGDLRDRSRVNIPGRYLDLGVLTERDKDFLMEGVKNSIEFYALSFVQDKSNVIHLQKLLYDNGQNASIIAKIETKSGYDNIDSISSVSDYVMVARGDLGVEMPLEEVVLAQKTIINEAHKHGVPTIVATQMLESMVESSSPTRAEVADVTNAILDNADSVMLSEETAIGKHPADAVGYLSRIADYVEGVYRDFPEPEQFFGNR
ncbi:MAG TPA: pyruvate kinase, partial [Thermoplasmataceae archaeon]|nr:pyruvate kinase [Thermoplasmataceae archaeon]